jgi:hypothetical protein
VVGDLHVVDTNVLFVARRRPEDGWSEALADACEELIDEVRCAGRVATDAAGEIIDEYFHGLSHSGQPTLADSFAVWVRDNRHGWGDEAIVDTDPQADGTYPSLGPHGERIDPSDRKFVATAQLSKAPIHQAVDVKWLEWVEALEGCGVEVRWVDESLARSLFYEKFGRDPKP